LAQEQLISIPPPLIPTSPPPYNMSQPDYVSIIRNLEQQIAMLMAAITGGAVRRAGRGGGAMSTEVARP